MIPAELKAHAAVLKALARSKPHVLKRQIPKLSPDVVRVLQNISHNVLKGSVKLNKRQKEKLRRHRQSLSEIALKRTGLKRSKKILQKGGFLAALLAPLAGLVAKLLIP